MSNLHESVRRALNKCGLCPATTTSGIASQIIALGEERDEAWEALANVMPRLDTNLTPPPDWRQTGLNEYRKQVERHGNIYEITMWVAKA